MEITTALTINDYTIFAKLWHMNLAFGLFDATDGYNNNNNNNNIIVGGGSNVANVANGATSANGASCATNDTPNAIEPSRATTDLTRRLHSSVQWQTVATTTPVAYMSNDAMFATLNGVLAAVRATDRYVDEVERVAQLYGKRDRLKKLRASLIDKIARSERKRDESKR